MFEFIKALIIGAVLTAIAVLIVDCTYVSDDNLTCEVTERHTYICETGD